MQEIELNCLLYLAALKEFLGQAIWPENNVKQLPPIRYEGDITEIYLA